MSLLKSLAFKKRENFFKNEIIQELKNTIKEIQSFPPYTQEKLTTNTVTNALCTILEALFLHGLRETFLSKMKLMTSDMIKKPERNFWSIVLIFSHKEIITRVNKLSLLTNDIGRCRAWLRLALNDKELVGYMDTMSRDPKSLAEVYKNTAFLRDSDQLEIAIKLLEGILQYEFDLPVNSSFLNAWPDAPLLKSGIWSPPMKEELKGPVFDGIDILAHEIVKDARDIVKEEVNVSLGSFNSTSSTIEYNPVKVDEDALLKQLLKSPPSTSKTRTNKDKPLAKMTTENFTICQSDVKYDSASERLNNEVQLVKPVEPEAVDKDTTSEAAAQSKEMDGDVQSKTDPQDSKRPETKQFPVEKTKKPNVKPWENLKEGDDVSFNTVLERYRNPSQTPIDGVNLDALTTYYKAHAETESWPLPPTSHGLSPPPSSPTPDSYEGFEIVSASMLPLELPQFAQFTACLTQLTRERTLRTQNYSCHHCFVPIGMNFAHHCWFTGHYFCADCFGHCSSIIPARLLFNWDFTQRPVSAQAALFLTEVSVHPVFNVKLLNPRLYLLVDKLTQVHYLRMKLNHIRAYLVSCKTTENYLHTELWPRDYLFESLHTYSIQDLKEVQSGKLVKLLNAVISFGVRHISSCVLCKLKGHLCELCRASPKLPRSHTNSPDSAAAGGSPASRRTCDVIYPFDLEGTHTCRECHATYHKDCWRGECPRCERIRRRRGTSGGDTDSGGKTGDDHARASGDLETNSDGNSGETGNDHVRASGDLETNSDGSSELQSTSNGRALIPSESKEKLVDSDVEHACDSESKITTDVRSDSSLLVTNGRRDCVDQNEPPVATSVGANSCEVVRTCWRGHDGTNQYGGTNEHCGTNQHGGTNQHSGTNQHGKLVEKGANSEVHLESSSSSTDEKGLTDNNVRAVSTVESESVTSPIKSNYSTVKTNDQVESSLLKSNSTVRLDDQVGQFGATSECDISNNRLDSDGIGLDGTQIECIAEIHSVQNSR